MISLFSANTVCHCHRHRTRSSDITVGNQAKVTGYISYLGRYATDFNRKAQSVMSIRCYFFDFI